MKERQTPGPRPAPLTISQLQRAVLQKIISRPSSPQQIVKRAEIICASSSETGRNEQIARALKVSAPKVIRWRSRWREAQERLAAQEKEGNEQALAEAILTLLADGERSGAPIKFSAESVCQIIAVACEAPQSCDRPISEWTARELADEVVKRQIVSSISVRQTGRFLKMRSI